VTCLIYVRPATCPAGYRTLARRLARDLRQVLDDDALASDPRGYGADAAATRRHIARAWATVRRFESYDQKKGTARASGTRL